MEVRLLGKVLGFYFILLENRMVEAINVLRGIEELFLLVTFLPVKL